MHVPKSLARTAGSVLASLFLAAPAFAGGIGVSVLGGTHSENVWFYDGAGTQYLEVQQRPTWGFGMEAILGDKDYKLLGVMRFSYVSEAPPTTQVNLPLAYEERLDSEGNDLGPEVPVRTDAKEIGEITAGLLWGIWGDPTGLQANVLTSVGSGALTKDSTEYVLFEVAPGLQYTMDDRVQFHVSAGYQLRWRKGLAHGPRAMAGVRYLFD
jgi:hypothetical protein